MQNEPRNLDSVAAQWKEQQNISEREQDGRVKLNFFIYSSSWWLQRLAILEQRSNCIPRSIFFLSFL